MPCKGQRLCARFNADLGAIVIKNEQANGRRQVLPWSRPKSMAATISDRVTSRLAAISLSPMEFEMRAELA